ncbi:MAG: hypothetical protein ACON3Z_19540 [Bradymonadia bacterium]
MRSRILIIVALCWLQPAAAEKSVSEQRLNSICQDDQKVVEIKVHLPRGAHHQTKTGGDHWLRRQFDEANRLFLPIGLCFFRGSVHHFDRVDSHVKTRRQRTRMGREHARLESGAINLFIVDRLDDIDIPGEQIRGVHWRDPKARMRKRWIFLSRIAGVMVLAHELGHYFSLPHSKEVVSLMNKTKRTYPPISDRRFSAKELKIMANYSAHLFEKKALRDHREGQR